MLVTTFGMNSTADGAWSVEVSDSSLALSRYHVARGEGWTGSDRVTTSPQGWRAHAGWFVFVENESRVWAYNGERLLLLHAYEADGQNSRGTTYSSRFPCAVPAQVYSRLSPETQRTID